MKVTKIAVLVFVLGLLLVILLGLMRAPDLKTPTRNAAEGEHSDSGPAPAASPMNERRAKGGKAVANESSSPEFQASLPWQDSSVNFLVRLDEFRDFVTAHDATVRESCLAYLESLRGRQKDDQVLFEAGMANEVMGELVRWPKFEAGLALAFHEMATDPSHLLVVRDYAVQHMASWVARLRPAPAFLLADPGEVKKETDAAWQLLWSIASDGERQLAGTALIGLQLFADTFAPDEAREYEQALRSILEDPQIDPGLRASALSLARDFNRPELVDLARSTMQNGEPSRLLEAALRPGKAYANAGHARHGRRTAENFKNQPTSVLP